MTRRFRKRRVSKESEARSMGAGLIADSGVSFDDFDEKDREELDAALGESLARKEEGGKVSERKRRD